MSTALRIRPSNDFLLIANWEELYALAKHWQSDMAFYHDEMRFLRNLIDRYFIWMIKDDNINKVQTIINKLIKLEKRQDAIIEKIHLHLSHLQELIKKTSILDELRFRNEHMGLEDDMVNYMKAFNEIKKEVFTITEMVMDSERLQHLISNN